MLQTKLQSHTLWVRKILEDSSFFGENLCILQWDKSNLQNSPGKKEKKGSFFDPSKSYLAPNVGGVEESGNNSAFIII